MTLSGSVTLVTGAARGIGLALTGRLCREGGRVLMADADAAALEEAATGLPSDRVAIAVADVRFLAQLEAAAGAATARWGPLDAWVNNAGLARHRRVTDYTEDDLDLMTDVNLKGAVFGCQVALRHFAAAGRGRIVNVISTAALRGIPTESFYCATKWGLRGFTQALAEEAAPLGVAVTAILPGGVDTGFWDAAVDREMPVGDFLTPAQVADAIVAVLAQDDACVTRELVLRSLKDRDFAGDRE
ncbi:MAG: SDR family oxidoreductase [Verrucomicrobiae bacterium]|nr:SDR family oxidoreductase [Verrucomicrobiae bacterium]MCP5540473.1 SDR family oxidoreductase [Akkermansiaceae bacterium]